jgi:hypothetical protein
VWIVKLAGGLCVIAVELLVVNEIFRVAYSVLMSTFSVASEVLLQVKYLTRTDTQVSITVLSSKDELTCNCHTRSR